VIWQLVALLGAVSATPKGDRVEVREGSDVLTSFVPSTPAARRGAPVVRQVAAAGRELVEVRLPLSGSPPRQELWIGERGPRGLTALWTGMVGATDADGETAREVVAGADGLELYQTATRLGRCDGVPVRLFRERWDFAQRRFRPAPPTLPAPAAQTLQARRGDPDMPAGRPVSGFFWTGASSAAGAKDARSLGAPWALNDGDPGTVWAAGGDGRGDWVTARSSTQGAAIVGLRITPGPEAWRPRKLTLVLGPADDQRFDVDLTDSPGKKGTLQGESWWVRLPKPVPSSCMTVILREGGPGGAPAIGDLDVITDLDGPDGVARLVEQVRAGTDCESRIPLLAAVGEAAARPVAAAIQQGPGPGRECLLSVLDRMKALDPAVTPAVVAGLERASPAEERLVLGLLPRLSPPPVAALAGMLGDEKLPDDDRARAARGLAALDRPEAWTALVAAAGAGSPGLRAGVRELLAGTKVPLAAEVRGALESQPPVPRRADLVFVLGAAAAREPEQRAASLEVLRAATGSADFELVARAVTALGRLGDEAAVTELSQLRGRSPDACSPPAKPPRSAHRRSC